MQQWFRQGLLGGRIGLQNASSHGAREMLTIAARGAEKEDVSEARRLSRSRSTGARRATEHHQGRGALFLGVPHTTH
jgi:hypothetical protein